MVSTTACKWDTVIPFVPLWKQYERVINDNGVIVLTASQPFTTALISSNIKLFKYEWIWQKDQGVNFQLVKKQPLKVHENIIVFYKQQPKYSPQGIIPCNIKKSNKFKGGNLGHCSSELKRKEYQQEFKNYPISVQKFNRERGFHPTQKPVALFEYLIKTYTNEGDTVLDNCAGSGTTGIAAEMCGRNSIMIEKEQKYCDIIKKRMAEYESTRQECLFL